MTATEDDALAGRLILPTAPGAPVTVTTKHPALRMTVVERSAVPHLGENWNAPGVSIPLLNKPPPKDDTDFQQTLMDLYAMRVYRRLREGAGGNQLSNTGEQ